MSRQKRWRDKQSDSYRETHNERVKEYQKTLVGRMQLRAAQSNTCARARGAEGRIGCGHIFALMMEQHGVGMDTPCASCGVKTNDWHLDHKTPIVFGGAHTQENMQLLCRDCHKAKSAEERVRMSAERRASDKSQTEMRFIVASEVNP